jgi:hypothetical protein
LGLAQNADLGLRKVLARIGVEDISEIGGFWYFYITNNALDGVSEKRLKTMASERYVPIHSTLLSIGFLEFVRVAQKSGRKKLFVGAKSNSYGNFRSVYSNWFSQQFLKRTGIYHPETTFHSLGHNFRDALKRGNVSVFLMKELLGWSFSGVEFGYGGPSAIAALSQTIELVSYPGLDFTNLHTEAGRSEARLLHLAARDQPAPNQIAKFDDALLEALSRGEFT